MITFEWDPPKAATNLKKHQISFEEARSVFFDEFAVQFIDEAHSLDEERFLLLGMSSGAKLLIVCHCERNEGEVIRIISARKATKRESEFYQGGHI
ncbi:MAG: BrnT family toxin [Betaproteobacteria bacterium]